VWGQEVVPCSGRLWRNTISMWFVENELEEVMCRSRKRCVSLLCLFAPLTPSRVWFGRVLREINNFWYRYANARRSKYRSLSKEKCKERVSRKDPRLTFTKDHKSSCMHYLIFSWCWYQSLDLLFFFFCEREGCASVTFKNPVKRIDFSVHKYFILSLKKKGKITSYTSWISHARFILFY